MQAKADEKATKENKTTKNEPKFIKTVSKRKSCSLVDFKAFQRVPNNDIIFFRLGYLNYMKLNEMNMVDKFKKNTWYKIDLILNW